MVVLCKCVKKHIEKKDEIYNLQYWNSTEEESINVKKKLNVICFWVHFPPLFAFENSYTIVTRLCHFQEITRISVCRRKREKKHNNIS